MRVHELRQGGGYSRQKVGLQAYMYPGYVGCMDGQRATCYVRYITCYTYVTYAVYCIYVRNITCYTCVMYCNTCYKAQSFQPFSVTLYSQIREPK